ncbi:MAG: LamG-like jellyroll fold domain-containing protein, partial [Candidatus Binatia bacterium]
LTPAGNTSPLFIGQFGGNSDRLDGTIDEVRIYNRALSQAEIQTDMNSPVGSGSPDTTAPSVPGNLGATAVSSSQINLSWTASTDTVGVTQYRVERCQGAGCTNFTQIATPTGTTLNDTGLSASTSYSYRVRAADEAVNLSGYSNTATQITQAASQPSQGLRAAYAFSEGTGTTTADTSGNVNIGTLTNGPVWTSQGKYSNALSFDGVNDFVSVADNATLDLSGAGTIEAWVKLDALGRWHSVIAKGNANSSAAHNYALEVTDSDRARCILGSGGSFRELDSTVSIVAGQFRHLACTWDGTTLSLYIDGTLNASVAQGLTPAGNTSPLFIGQFGGNSDRLDGTIDEVRIYNRALSQAEI